LGTDLVTLADADEARGGSMKKIFAAMSVLGFTAMNVAAGVTPASADPCTSWVLHGPVTVQHSDGFTIKISNWNGASADSTPDAATLYLQNGSPAQIDAKGYPVAFVISSGVASAFEPDQDPATR
jgi:hypothetical protein